MELIKFICFFRDLCSHIACGICMAWFEFKFKYYLVDCNDDVDDNMARRRPSINQTHTSHETKRKKISKEHPTPHSTEIQTNWRTYKEKQAKKTNWSNLYV